MNEIIAVYGLVILMGLFSVIASLIRLKDAATSRNRRRTAISLLGAILIILISLAAIYLSLNEILSKLTVAILSVVFLSLNYFAFWKYSKPE